MRVQVCKVLANESPQRHSYLDATDEIFALPSNVLKLSFGRPPRIVWPEQCTKETLTEFLSKVRALATQV